MSRGVDLILVIRQKIIILLRAKLIVTKGVPVTIRVSIVNLNLINIRVEALLEESKGIGVEEFIV